MSSCTRSNYSLPRPPYHIATFRLKEELHPRPHYWWGLCPLRELLVSRDLQVGIARCHAWVHLKLKNTCFHKGSRILCFDNWVRNHSLQLFSSSCNSFSALYLLTSAHIPFPPLHTHSFPLAKVRAQLSVLLTFSALRLCGKRALQSMEVVSSPGVEPSPGCS